MSLHDRMEGMKARTYYICRRKDANNRRRIFYDLNPSHKKIALKEKQSKRQKIFLSSFIASMLLKIRLAVTLGADSRKDSGSEDGER